MFYTLGPRFGLSFDDLRAALPTTSFPANQTIADAELGITSYTSTPTPDYDRITHTVREAAPIDGVQQWEVIPLPADVAERNRIEAAKALQDTIVQATQDRLDAFARTRNYDSILSACTYATSSVLTFAQEAAYCIAARDETWATLYQVLADVQSGSRPVPAGYADIEPLLPALEWPV